MQGPPLAARNKESFETHRRLDADRGAGISQRTRRPYLENRVSTAVHGKRPESNMKVFPKARLFHMLRVFAHLPKNNVARKIAL